MNSSNYVPGLQMARLIGTVGILLRFDFATVPPHQSLAFYPRGCVVAVAVALITFIVLTSSAVPHPWLSSATAVPRARYDPNDALTPLPCERAETNFTFNAAHL